MKIDPYWFNDDDKFWEDIKCEEVVFPTHTEDMNGECITYSIEELNSK